MAVILKVWLILGIISAIWFLAELPDFDEPDEEFYQCSMTILKTIIVWPWLLYKTMRKA